VAVAEWWPSGRSWAGDWRRSWSDLLSASSAVAASLGWPASDVLPGDPFSVVVDAARAWLVGLPKTFRISGRDLTLTLTDLVVEGSDVARAMGQYGQVRVYARDVQWDGYQLDRLEILARNVHLRPGRQPALVAAPLLVEVFVPASVASRWLAAALPRFEVTWRDGLPQLSRSMTGRGTSRSSNARQLQRSLSSCSSISDRSPAGPGASARSTSSPYPCTRPPSSRASCSDDLASA
jgi:hypothetical protein